MVHTFSYSRAVDSFPSVASLLGRELISAASNRAKINKGKVWIEPSITPFSVLVENESFVDTTFLYTKAQGGSITLK